ncbi:MAG: HAMP domain-containing protein [Proteobacteria bacterium]|nr:HAMP domain-containing protein [Pseudomonadota bacterium]MBU1686261.1 HAMP domain-containing protein [Pseudomonadota bacterium]
MKRVGIHIWLILAAVILMSSSLGAFFAGISLFSDFAHKRFEERTVFLARYLALNSELGILIGDHMMLAELAENLLSQEDIVRVEITSREGDQLTSVTSPAFHGNGGKLLRVVVPVEVKGGADRSNPLSLEEQGLPSEVIGQVSIDYTVAGINAMVGVIRDRFYLLSAGFVTISLLMFVLLSRFLAKPVRNLVFAAREVARGNLDLRVTPGNLSETRELAEAFNAMLDSLQQSKLALEKATQEMVRQKTLAELGKFSMMIAHEVKNPLGIIKSSLDLLKQDLQLTSDNLLVDYIEDEIHRMNRLIEDFLSFARPASPSFRESDINQLIRECVIRFELQPLGNGVDFRLHLPEGGCLLKIDPDLMTRVFSNILKNGLEMSRGQGGIDIVAEDRNNEWVCRVNDRGPGIHPADLERIFEPFFTKSAKGTGLGLAFAAQVVNGHNGRIEAENLPGGGASFIITLPKEN